MLLVVEVHGLPLAALELLEAILAIPERVGFCPLLLKGELVTVGTLAASVGFLTCRIVVVLMVRFVLAEASVVGLA